ncbi:helix-turn-helix domain-containing protein [Streptomyces microflavus]|uniref:helix-turn-helix domain-containing protein n=1 Tax=Streptomyces microflavus TaxID=1919 RepID=UPI0036835D3D
MTTQPERDLRAQVKAALTTARISQAEAARQLDLSTKHMSHMLTGRATLTLDWADRILTLCGMTLAVAAIPDTGQAHLTQRVPLDDLTSDALDALYNRLDRVRNAWQESRARWWKANARIDELDARVRELEAEVARLTAGQCIDSRAMCEQHHAPPVAGCPYPRCRAARGDQPAPAPRTPGVVDLPDISNA